MKIILILIIIKEFINELNENIYNIRINIKNYKVEILYEKYFIIDY